MKKHKQEIIVYQEENKFNKPNILINVIHNKELTTKDKKVYNVFLRQLLNQNIESYQTNIISTTITQICRELNTTKRNDIAQIIEKLEDTRIVFDHLIDNKEYTTTTRLLTSKSIKKQNEDSVVVEFSKHIANEILLHWEQYTKLDLMEMNNLKKGYSLTFYEMFKSKLGKYPYQYQNYSEKRLREKTNTLEKYELIKDFNKYVIKNSIEEINSKSNLDITLLENKIDKKSGERIYKFFIKQDKNYELSFNRFKNIIRNLSISKNNIKYKIRTQTYSLDRTLENDTKPLWTNEKTLKIVEREQGIKIWKGMYEFYLKSPLDFLEKMNIDIETFIEYDYKTKEEN